MARKLAPPDSEAAKQRKCKRRLYWVCGALGLGLAAIATGIAIYCWHGRITRHPCDLAHSIPLRERDYTRHPNGSLVHHSVVYPSGYYYTVDGVTLGCLCAIRPCIRKCCNADEYFVPGENSSSCKKNPRPSALDNITVPVYNDGKYSNEVVKDRFGIVYGDVCPNGKYVLDPEDSRDKRIFLSDGKILLTADNEELDMSEYCMEEILGDHGVQTMVCFPPEDRGAKAAFTLYPGCMILSTPFLLCTFLVYAVISELRNLHGKSLMCHVLSLLTAYVVLTVVQLQAYNDKEMPVNWCKALAYVIQFSFLATFFWLNVMCFDLWWTFSGIKPFRGSMKEREHKKFILYSLYAWGGPLLIFAVSIFMDNSTIVPDSYIKPKFGVDKCWFLEWKATGLYFYLPISILILLNIAMFITTAIRLSAHRREMKVLNTGDSRRNVERSERQRFNLYLKLFIVMGINWVMELVSYAVGGPKYIWYLTDIGNTLQGILIFVIFVCKRRILRLLNQKLCPKWNLVSGSSNCSGSKVRSREDTSSFTLSKTVSNGMEVVALNGKPAGKDYDSENV